MTLKQIIGTIKNLALKHPNINSVYEGSVYDNLNASPSNKYASVVLTQTTHTQDEMFDHYGFVIFYVDRLIDDVEDNRVQIQSIGKSMLTNIVEAFCYEFDAEHNDITFHPFTQKFADETAGVYIDIVIDTPKDSICAERYWDEQWSAPIITIKNATEQIHITENGHFEVTYDPTNYTGLEKVIIDVEFDTNPYFQEGYDNGYQEGEEQGYNNGYGNGVEEQKNKLEPITITENGSYSREDGYNEVIVDVPDLNGSYDDGYNDGYTNGDGDGYNRGYAEGEANGVENAGEIIAQTAQVLNITENGTYYTRYSLDVTGYFDESTPFYNYAQLNNIVYDTGIKPNPNTKVELWWDNTTATKENFECFIFGTQNPTWKMMYSQHLDGYIGEINYNDTGVFSIPVGWHHIIMSFEDGLVLDNHKIGDFGRNLTDEIDETIYINGSSSDTGYNINGRFGMIKITKDGETTTIIPTEEGYKNYTTGELLEVVNEGIYDYINNGPIYEEGNLIKTVNVNIVPKINVVDAGIKFAESTFSSVPEWADFEGITNMNNMFSGCGSLESIPLIDTSNVTTMYRTFHWCGALQTIPLIDTSNVTSMKQMFQYCSRLESVPHLNTSNVVDFQEMFSSCDSLKSIPQFDTSKATTMYQMFQYCSKLVSIPPLDASSVTYDRGPFGTSDFPNLTDVGGFINLKVSWNYTYYGINKLPNLTYQSCINILNGLYDFTGNGETPNSSQGQLKVHQNFLNLVGDEISIATNKGWQITA